MGSFALTAFLANLAFLAFGLEARTAKGAKEAFVTANEVARDIVDSALKVHRT